VIQLGNRGKLGCAYQRVQLIRKKKSDTQKKRVTVGKIKNKKQPQGLSGEGRNRCVRKPRTGKRFGEGTILCGEKETPLRKRRTGKWIEGKTGGKKGKNKKIHTAESKSFLWEPLVRRGVAAGEILCEIEGEESLIQTTKGEGRGGRPESRDSTPRKKKRGSLEGHIK